MTGAQPAGAAPSLLCISRPVHTSKYLLRLCKENTGFIPLPCSTVVTTSTTATAVAGAVGGTLRRKNAIKV